MDADKHLTARTGPKQLRAPDLAVGGTAGHSVRPGSGDEGQAVTSGVADFICQLVTLGLETQASPTTRRSSPPTPCPGRPPGPQWGAAWCPGGRPLGSLSPAQGHSKRPAGDLLGGGGAGLKGSRAETPPVATTCWLSN